MSQKIIEQARVLGDLISQSDELKEMREAEVKFANDPIAQELVAKYQAIQSQIDAAKREEKEVDAEVQKEFDELERQVENNATISEYLKSQGNFADLMDGVNYLIMKAINGDSEGCEAHGGCSSCSGCH